MFFKVGLMFTDWQNRIPVESLTTLKEKGIVIAHVDNTKDVAHIFVETDEGIYCNSTDNLHACPEATLQTMLMDTTVNMPAHVRVTAVKRMMAA